MPAPTLSPSELRNMFGANLRTLAQAYPSISELSRQLRINRTQFNRYLSGESFPRPDVLARICEFFEVDARVLLEPVGEFGKDSGPTSSTYLRDYLGASVQDVPQEELPNGLYRFSRRSFVNSDLYVTGLVLVAREGQHTYVRGFEAKSAMAMQGMPTNIKGREFRGFVMKIEDGVAITVSRIQGLTASFNYLSRVLTIESNFWVGYTSRTAREDPESDRVTRLVYEYLGKDTSTVMAAARQAGMCKLDDLHPFHQRLLKSDAPFR